MTKIMAGKDNFDKLRFELEEDWNTEFRRNPQEIIYFSERVEGQTFTLDSVLTLHKNQNFQQNNS